MRRFLGLLIVVLLLPTGLLAQSPAGTPAAPATDAPAAPAAVGEERVGDDLVDLYEQAVAYLEAIVDDYRRIKSIQLAQVRDIAFEEAYENISSVMPVLQPIDKALLRKAIRHPGDIQKHKLEVERIKTEVEMMIELAAKLLLEIEVVHAEIMAHAEEREKTLEEIVQQEQFDPEAEIHVPPPPERDSPQFQSLEQAALEDPNEVAKDLTPLMRPTVDIKDLTRDVEDEGPAADLFVGSDDLTGMMGQVDLDKINRIQGRKIREGAEPVEWMFLDTWYTIGPFPNPMRVNLNRKFPPETVVDFDAAYPGKDGKLVRWQFVQSGEPRVVPADDEEYAIYYAYTEIWLDRPMDLWVAIGSDDKANVWLNGMPIWISGDQLKGWRVNEGLRKVSFNAGRNRVLYRIENGWLQTAFSLGIRVAP